MEKTTILLLSALAVAAIAVAAIGVGYAYQASYSEDTIEASEDAVASKYITVTKDGDAFAMPTAVSAEFSTVTSDGDDTVLDRTQRLDVTEVVDQAEKSAHADISGDTYTVSSDDLLGTYTVTLDSEDDSVESAVAAFFVGKYAVTQYGAASDLTATASFAEGAIAGVSLHISPTDAVGEGSSIELTGYVAGGSKDVYVYAVMDIAELFDLTEYNTVTIPSMTVSVTAAPEARTQETD